VVTVLLAFIGAYIRWSAHDTVASDDLAAALAVQHDRLDPQALEGAPECGDQVPCGNHVKQPASDLVNSKGPAVVAPQPPGPQPADPHTTAQRATATSQLKDSSKQQLGNKSPETPEPELSETDYDDLIRETVADHPAEDRGERTEWNQHTGWGRKEDIHVRI